MSYARNSEITANTTHISSDGTDHTLIDQDVTNGSSPTLDGANITGVDAANVDIADGGGIITATTVEGALQENRTAINLNTAKSTNVPTALSTGSVTATTYGITSDGSANDVVLAEATTSLAGLLGADKWDEIVASTTHLTSDGSDHSLVGTAVQEGDTTTAAMSFVIDEDTLVSDLATKVPTQQSVKAYVDAEVTTALTSEMSYKGAYNATTDTPNLDTTPIATAIGDVYAVTVAGTFFATAVEAGDLLIANQATATLEAHWDIVQANLTAASIKTQYESNANTNAFTDTEQTKLTNIEALADVTDATNVASAGAVMESDATTAAMSFVVDEDTMSSNSATKVPTQQSVKAYVDAAAPTPTVVTKTTTYTIATSDDIVICTSGTFTVTLPTAVSATGDMYRVKNSGAGVITLDGNGAQTIDGAANHVLNQFDSLTVVSDGTNWVVV